MSKSSRERSRQQAAYMKEMGIVRTAGSCPWGCDRSIPNGGVRLMEHLTRCQGSGTVKRVALVKRSLGKGVR